MIFNKKKKKKNKETTTTAQVSFFVVVAFIIITIITASTRTRTLSSAAAAAAAVAFSSSSSSSSSSLWNHHHHHHHDNNDNGNLLRHDPSPCVMAFHHHHHRHRQSWRSRRRRRRCSMTPSSSTTTTTTRMTKKNKRRTSSSLASTIRSSSTILDISKSDNDVICSMSSTTKKREHAERSARNQHDNHALNALLLAAPENPIPMRCRSVSPKEIQRIYCNDSGNNNNNNNNKIVSFPPQDLPAGCLLRIGPNSDDINEGILDGDGMIHCITIPPQDDAAHDYTCWYTSTYIETVGRKKELEIHKKQMEKHQNNNNDDSTTTTTPTPPPQLLRYKGTLGAAPYGWPLISTLIRNGLTFQTLRCQKDTCNTSIGENDGRLLALMEQCPPTEFSVDNTGRICTIESGTNLDGAIPTSDVLTGGTLSAHGHTCPITKEYITLSYQSSTKPYARVDFFHNAWTLKRSIPINDLDIPVMIHDCTFTPSYVVVFDIPVTIKSTNIILNKFPLQYEPKQHNARIGLVPRKQEAEEEESTNSNIIWFHIEPCVMLHTVNAYEKVNQETGNVQVAVQALRGLPNKERSFFSCYTASFLYEWILDINTGTVFKEQYLNSDQIVEFPVVK